MTFVPNANHNFYIDNDTDDFYLRENDAWVKKGRMVRANLVGLISEGPFPFTDQVFELALGTSAVRYYDAFSQARSEVVCEYPAQSPCEIVLTDNLAGFLSTGTNAICRAAITPASQRATLTFTDTIVSAFAPLWIVMPLTPDLTMAGLRAIFGGEPV